MILSQVVGLGKGLEMQPTQRDPSFSNGMKEIRKAVLRRQVLENPHLAAKLVALEASPVYNSRGDLIQSLGDSGHLRTA